MNRVRSAVWFVTGMVFLVAISLYAFSRAAIWRPLNGESSAKPGQSAIGADSEKTFADRGITVRYSPPWVSEIKAETRSALDLQSKTDTGQGVAPKHIVLKFIGPLANESSFFPAQISIYRIADYRKSLALSEEYVQKFDDRIQTLKWMLHARPTVWGKEMPYLPFSVGGSQQFHARLDYLNSRNGRGVAFLTQYNIEPALINNEGLTYTFQGLTNDDLYFVSATFPVTLSSLPETYESRETKNYKLTIPKSFRGREYESFEQRHDSYLREVILELEAIPPTPFSQI